MDKWPTDISGYASRAKVGDGVHGLLTQKLAMRHVDAQGSCSHIADAEIASSKRGEVLPVESVKQR